MNPGYILEYTVKALMLVLLLSMVPIVVATTIGLVVSLLQALTQIQEQTLSFAIKLMAIAFTLLTMGRWLGSEIYNFALNIFKIFPWLVQ